MFKNNMNNKLLDGKIAYIYNKELIEHCNKLPTMKNRASMVEDLIESYKLLSEPNMVVVQSENATEEELKSFHSSSYIDFLKTVNSFDSSLDEIEEEHLEFGLGYDCPILNNIYDFASSIAGGSISAAKLLAGRKCNTVINWYGGWHHAQRDSAEGFCYVNDVVLAIQTMSRTFDKILYVDLDIHHGDGVQNAFEHSSKILTLSFHKYSIGFFPNTGTIDDIGLGKGKYFSLNVPLQDGIGDKTFIHVFNNVFPLVFKCFNPNALVVQCGADGLNGDLVGQCNLTLKGIGESVKEILDCNIPTLFLGGGGYNLPNTARLWTYLTSLILKKELDNDIPDISMYFSEYGPSYELHIEEGRRKDYNTAENLRTVIENIKSYCRNIS